MAAEYIRIGLIAKPQGIKGEAKINPLSDDANRFQGLQHVFIEQDGRYVEAGIRVNRVDRNAVFAFIDGYYTREAIEGLRNAYLCVRREDAIELAEDSWFVSDLIGIDVRADGQSIGKLREVISTGAVDAYLVQKAEGGTMMFPALKLVIERVDIEAGEMQLNVQELEKVRVDED